MKKLRKEDWTINHSLNEENKKKGTKHHQQNIINFLKILLFVVLQKKMVKIWCENH